MIASSSTAPAARRTTFHFHLNALTERIGPEGIPIGISYEVRGLKNAGKKLFLRKFQKKICVLQKNGLILHTKTVIISHI